MAGPAESSTIPFIVPAGEAQKQYAPSALAYRIQNMELTPEGTLRSITGPAPIEPNRGKGYPTLGVPYGICHANLLGGIADTLILRHGGALARHAGWNRDWEPLTLPTGISTLNNEPRPRWPDQWVVAGDRIIWTNAVDRPLVIAHDGMVTELGFREAPSSPEVKGPTQTLATNRNTYYPNSDGYTWPGNIGSVGDSDGETGSILEGEWYYYAQYESIYGDLGPLSAASAVVRLYTQTSVDPYGSDAKSGISRLYTGVANILSADIVIDDLTRQFMARIGGDAPPHATAIRLYRTRDVRRNTPEPLLVARIPGTSAALYPDNISDGHLGSPATPCISVPALKLIAAHQGRLVMCPTTDPGCVRWSEPGFFGTFPEFNYIYPDSGGAEVTGIASHGGRLLVFTERAVFDISDYTHSITLARGIGCVAPRSIKAMPNGLLVWLGADAFYAMTPDGTVQDISSDFIHRTVRHGLNKGRVRLAVAEIAPASREYRCFMSPAGVPDQRLILTYDADHGWKRQDHNIGYHDVTVTDDARGYMIACGADLATTQRNVFVLDHEYDDYNPPSRDAFLRSGWIRGDENALTKMYVRRIFVAFVDDYNGTITARFYRNGSWAAQNTQTDVREIGPDDGQGIAADVASTAVIGTARVRDPRLVWREIPADLRDCYTWAFELRATYNPTASSAQKLHIAAFAFDVTVVSMGDPKARIPRKDDV